MKEIRPKEDKAVSPIIATILLIAITVVLAATLVTILGGFTHGVSNTVEIAGASVFEGPDSGSASHYTATLYLNISSSSSNISSSQVTVIATMSNGHTNTFTLSSTNVTAGSKYFDAGSTYEITASLEFHSTVFKSIELTYKGSSIYTSGLITIS